MNANTAVADRIEQKIDREVTGSLAIIGTGGSTNIAPRNMGELMEFAKLMALSGPCIRPAFRNNPGACLAISLQAFRWGMDPIAVSNKAYMINDQLAFESQLVHAVVNERAPLTKRLRPVYSGEGGKRRCKIVGHLKGEDEPLEYESPEVGSIPVKNSPLWKGDPDQQLFYFSVRSWARRHVPEVLLGVYTSDEIEAQERHYGPENAKDVTPTPRPTREQFRESAAETKTEAKAEGFTIVTGDGEVRTFDDPRDAARAFITMLQECAGKDATDGLWESNTLSAQLRDRDLADLAEQVRGVYVDVIAALAKKAAEAKTVPSNEGAKINTPAAEPSSPLKHKKAEWPAWVDWSVAEIGRMPQADIAGFMEAKRAEMDFVSEQRAVDWTRIELAIDGRRADG